MMGYVIQYVNTFTPPTVNRLENAFVESAVNPPEIHIGHSVKNPVQEEKLTEQCTNTHINIYIPPPDRPMRKSRKYNTADDIHHGVDDK